MTISEQDLHDALRPLAGDPLEDARAVLASLPAAPPPGLPGLPPVTWWLVGGALAVGTALGLGIGWGTAPEPPPPQPVVEKEKQPDKKPMAETEIEMMAFGDVRLTEPPGAPQDVRAGRWLYGVGATIETLDTSQAGLVVYPDDVQMRLDHDTVVRVVTATELSLTRGRLFVNTGSAGAQVSVETPLATVTVPGGRIMMTVADGSLDVIAVQGEALVRSTAGQIRQLRSRERVAIDADRGAETVEDVAFLGTATSWMTQMIILQQDGSELQERTIEIVRAYEEGEFRAAAATELRKLDYRCVAMLVFSIQERDPNDTSYRRDTAELVGQVSNFFTAEYLFPLLDDPDPAVRTTIFLALFNATGTDGDTGVDFWQEASRAERQAAIAEWKQKLR